MKRLSKPEFKPKSLLRLLLLILCGTLFGVKVYHANARSLVGNQLPTPFGYGAAVVLSGSMEPTLSAGDLILVKETEDYETDDVVVFQDGNSLVVHRILQIEGERITTKGDANNVADPPIHLSVVKGEVVGKLPWVGHVVEFLKTPVGTIGIVAAILLLLEIPRRNEKKRDEEARQKIIDEIERLKKDIES